jgi:hypothetical protein
MVRLRAAGLENAPDVEVGAIIEAECTHECVHQRLQRHRAVLRIQAEATKIRGQRGLHLQRGGCVVGEDGGHGG